MKQLFIYLMKKIKTYKLNKRPVYITGDIHGNFDIIVHKVKTLNISNAIIIVAGDCGLGFEKEESQKRTLKSINDKLKKMDVVLFLVRGNHDCPQYFDGNKINFPYVKAIPDYSIIQIYSENDIDFKGEPVNEILCVGGAISIDRRSRMLRYRINVSNYLLFHPTMLADEIEKNILPGYWEDEPPVYDKKKLDLIKKQGYKINHVITHTAPSFCEPQTKIGIENFLLSDNTLESDIDKERKIMDDIYNHLIKDKHPLQTWTYGHFHKHCCEYHNNIKFTLLNCQDYKFDMIEIGYPEMTISC